MEDVRIADLWFGIRKRIKTIALMTAAFGIIAFVLFAFVLSKDYAVQSTMVFGRPVTYTQFEENPNYEDVYNDVLLNQKMLATYAEIMKSEKILSQVIEKFGLDVTVKDLNEQLSIRTVNNTEVISLVVKDKDPQMAADIANEITTLFMGEVKNIQDDITVYMLDEAKVPEEPEESGTLLNTAIAALFGGFLGLVQSIYLTFTDKSFKSVSEFRKLYDIPMLGVSRVHGPVLKKAEKSGDYASVDESVRAIRTNIRFAMDENQWRSLVIASTNANEGKTLLSLALAKSLVANGKKVLLLEGNLRSGTLKEKVKTANEKGLYDVLTEKAVRSDVVTEHEGVAVVLAGTNTPFAAELLDSAQMAKLLAEAKQAYDYVIIDTPSLSEYTDGAVLAKQADGVVAIVAEGHTRKEEFDDTLEKLANVKANLVGIVFNEGV